MNPKYLLLLTSFFSVFASSELKAASTKNNSEYPTQCAEQLMSAYEYLMHVSTLKRVNHSKVEEKIKTILKNLIEKNPEVLSHSDLFELVHLELYLKRTKIKDRPANLDDDVIRKLFWQTRQEKHAVLFSLVDKYSKEAKALERYYRLPLASVLQKMHEQGIIKNGQNWKLRLRNQDEPHYWD